MKLIKRLKCFWHGHQFVEVKALDSEVRLCRCDRCGQFFAAYHLTNVYGMQVKHASWTEHHRMLWSVGRFATLDLAADHALSVRENQAIWVRQVAGPRTGHERDWAASLHDMDGEMRSGTYFGRNADEACRRLIWAMRL